MKSARAHSKQDLSIARQIRARIEHGGERLWRLTDFKNLPFTAVAQTLSRLARDGLLQRLSKGTYYRPGQSSFGPTLPNQKSVRSLAKRDKTLFPTGMGAASLLGFTTQVPRRSEIATPSSSLPRKLIGSDARIVTRRPEAWKSLTDNEAAILGFLRDAGRTSELPATETIKCMMRLLAKDEVFTRLMRVADSEPPRVRALLGALGEQIHVESKVLDKLRSSLNPLSRFDFGAFESLPNAKSWQAKGKRGRAALRAS